MTEIISEDFQMGEAYKVGWIDSCGTPAGWVDLEEDDYPTDIMTIMSYGEVINKSKDAIVLAQSVIPSCTHIKKQAMGIVTIPIVCITQFEKI